MTKKHKTQTPGQDPKPEQMPPQQEAPKVVREKHDPLPKVDTVDPKKITRAVLTDQGYVCPEPPADRKEPMR